MNKEIIFVAGVHGVGKTTFCNSLKEKLLLHSYTASSLIKTYNSDLDFPDKRIKEISSNQDALISSIQQNIKENSFILDGHFVLLNENGSIQKIPSETFKSLNPKYIVLLTEKPEIIYNRLENRGNNKLTIEIIKSLQISEVSYAKEISKTLNIPIYILENEEQKYNFLQ